MTKDITTLVDDVYDVLKHGAEPTEEALDALGNPVKELMKYRLSNDIGDTRTKDTLRMSNIGKPLRQLYYELKLQAPKEELPPQAIFKFLFGDLIELLFLFLAREAGHTVEHEQKTVHNNGVVGHIDAIIDGHLIDVKSTSKYAFKKFEENRLAQDDPFGYMKQLAGYAESEELKGNIKGAGFVAIGKELGNITYMPVDLAETKMEHPSAKIDKIREALSSDELPPRCYEAEPFGKSGNMKLGINCSYCPYKETCWSDSNNGTGLKKYLYSTGPVWLVDVVREPNVPQETE